MDPIGLARVMAGDNLAGCRLWRLGLLWRLGQLSRLGDYRRGG